MTQSKKASLLEQVIKTVSGFFVNWALWVWVIMPLWDIEMTMQENLAIMALFTVSAIARGYVLRRIFNWWDNGRRKRINS
jgi:hypothetical protein